MAKIFGQGFEKGSLKKSKKKKNQLSAAEFDDIINTLSQIPPPPSVAVSFTSGNSTNPYVKGGEDWMPDDAEPSDITEIKRQIDNFLDKVYPPFEPQVLSVFSPIAGQGVVKEYFLPALKVLIYYGKSFYSPQRHTLWENMELTAVCMNEQSGRYYKNANGDIVFTNSPCNDPPHFGCDCGIYGSVNLEEISEWCYRDTRDSMYQAMVIGNWEREDYLDPSHFEEPRSVICIVEPSPGATVHLCRKGWKASKAFISEIINETISTSDASSLLSEAWHRPIDLRNISRPITMRW